MRRRAWARRAVRLLVAAALVSLTFVAWRWWGGNFGVVVPGRFYRSAQLSPSALGRIISRNGIKAVLNLRGCNPDPWYRAERAATLAAGAIQVDVPMASDQWLSRDQARTLVEVLSAREFYPILIHCEWGAERTGLASAFAELLREGGTLAGARAQFSWRYLFLKTHDGKVMLGHLKCYQSWLKSQRLEHSPRQFRRWVAEVYRPRPGTLSREFWPSDPYPLRLITRQAGAEVRETALWSQDRPHGSTIHR
jgi:hypothetical protein